MSFVRLRDILIYSFSLSTKRNRDTRWLWNLFAIFHFQSSKICTIGYTLSSINLYVFLFLSYPTSKSHFSNDESIRKSFKRLSSVLCSSAIRFPLVCACIPDIFSQLTTSGSLSPLSLYPFIETCVFCVHQLTAPHNNLNWVQTIDVDA